MTEVDFVTVLVLVVVADVIERNNLSEVELIHITHMVCDDINHHPDVFLVASFDQFVEFFSSTKVLVDFIEVAGPVSVISTRSVSNNRRDPDSIEAHSLDIV